MLPDENENVSENEQEEMRVPPSPKEADFSPRSLPAQPPAERVTATDQRDRTPLSPVVREFNLKPISFDIEGALRAGMRTRQIVSGLSEAEELDPQWRNFIQAARRAGASDEDILAEVIGASTSTMEAIFSMGGRGLGRGTAAGVAASVVGRGVAGALRGASRGIALGPKGVIVGGIVGAIAGGLGGYLAADKLIESVMGESPQFTPSARTAGIAAETAGEIVGTLPAYIRMMPKAANAVRGMAERSGRLRAQQANRAFAPESDLQIGRLEKFIIGAGDSAQSRVGRLLLGGETIGAAVGAGIAQSVAPENPWLRMAAEVGGGVGSASVGVVGLGALSRLKSSAKASFNPEAIEAAGLRTALMDRLMKKDDKITPERIARMSPEEQATLLRQQAEELMTELRGMRETFEQAGVNVDAAAIVASPELRLLANYLKNNNPKFRIDMETLDEQNITALRSFARTLFRSEDENAIAAAALMRDGLNQQMIEETINTHLGAVDRFVAFARNMNPEDIAEKTARLTRNATVNAYNLSRRQAEALYDNVDMSQHVFGGSVARAFNKIINDPTLLSSERAAIPTAARTTSEKAMDEIKTLLEGDFAVLERMISDAQGVTVGELIGFRRNMNRRARKAGDNDTYYANLYRQLERAAADDLLNQKRITGWLTATGQPGVTIDERALPGQGFFVREGVPDEEAFVFAQGRPIIEVVRDPALDAANSFYRAMQDTFRRGFASKLTRRGMDRAYKLTDEKIIDALLPSQPAVREANFNALEEAVDFMRNQQRVLADKGIELDPAIANAIPDNPRIDTQGVFDLTLRYVARQAVASAPDGTLSVNVSKLNAIPNRFPQWFNRAPDDVKDLFANARVSQVAINASTSNSPYQRAKAANDEFASIIGASLTARRVGAHTVPGEVVARGGTATLIDELVKPVPGSTPDANFQALVSFAKRGTQANRQLAEQLQASGVDIDALTPERMQEGLLSAVARYGFDGGENVLFAEANRRLLMPLEEGKRSMAQILRDNNMISTEQFNNLKNVIRAGQTYEDLLSNSDELFQVGSIEEFAKSGIVPEVALRILGSAIGGVFASILGDGNSLIARGAASRAMLKVFQRVPSLHAKNALAEMLLKPDLEDMLKAFLDPAVRGETPEQIARRLQGSTWALGTFLFGPRPTTAQMRLLLTDYEQDRQVERPPSPVAPTPRPLPAPPPPPTAPPPQAMPQAEPTAQMEMPVPLPESSLSFERFMPQMAGAAPGGAPAPATAGGLPAAPVLFPNDPLLQAGIGALPQQQV